MLIAYSLSTWARVSDDHEKKLPKSLADKILKTMSCGMMEKSHLIVFDDLNVSK